jgi:hypothetical protein
MTDSIEAGLAKLYVSDGAQRPSDVLTNMTLRDIKKMAVPKGIFTAKTAVPAIAAAAAVMAIGLGPRILQGTPSSGSGTQPAPCAPTAHATAAATPTTMPTVSP